MDLLKEIVQSPAILKEIYGDLAKPGVQQVGKALESIIGLGNTVLWPVTLLNEKAKITLEDNLEKYRKKLEATPEEEVCKVAPEIGVPIAEKLSYVTNEELSEMYTELLSKASIKQKANVAHPSFVNIISNISPDEAILIKSIVGMPGIPFIEVQLRSKSTKEWLPLDPMMPGFSCLKKLQFPNNVHAYVSNLEGLGIFQIRQGSYLRAKNIYEPLEEQAKSRYSHRGKNHQDKTIIIKRGIIEITPLAKLLLRACFHRSKA